MLNAGQHRAWKRRARWIVVLVMLASSIASPALAGPSEPLQGSDEGSGLEGLPDVPVAEETAAEGAAQSVAIYNMIFPHLEGIATYSDTFGACRSGCSRTHEGIDILAPKMTPIVAVASGTVGWMQNEQGGNCCAMALNHDDGWASWYIHMNNDTPGTDDGQGWGFAPGIDEGVHVDAGQLIGWVGDSGNAEATVSHTHFELHRPAEPGENSNASGNRVKINPYNHLLAATVISGPISSVEVRGCDFDGDDHDDLAVGAPGEDLGASGIKVDAGIVTVLYGGNNGLSSAGSQRIKQGTAGVDDFASADDRFGAATACGDLDDDGYDDLVIGAPGEDLGLKTNTGALNILYGTSSGLVASGDNVWHLKRETVPGAADVDAAFGAALAVADFNNDGYDDIAVGVPGKSKGGFQGAGFVVILPGTAQGVVSASASFAESTAGISGNPEEDDGFGSTLAAGDFDGDGRFDLAIGIPNEDLALQDDAGAVAVLYGTSSGLAVSGEQRWEQKDAAVTGFAKSGDRFGAALAAGDFDGDGRDDLAIGVPGERMAGTTGGGVNVLYGSGAGITATDNRLIRQGSQGAEGNNENGDGYGSALASGDFDQDGYEDVAVGAPGEGLGPVDNAGAVFLLFGGSDGIDTDDDEIWTQDTEGIGNAGETGDGFGAWLASGDFGGAGVSSLAVGVPNEDTGAYEDSGVVHAIYGGPGGLRTGGQQVWSEDSPGIPGKSADGDGWARLSAVSP